MSEVDLSDAVVLEIGSRDEVTHELVRERLDEYQAAAPAPRLSVDETGPMGVGWPFTFVVRVRNEDGLDVCQAMADLAVAFNIRHA
jgi:hypothetical protein